MQRLRTDQIKPIKVAQTAHGLVVGNLVRFDGTNWVKAQADSAVNAEVVGFVVEIYDANSFGLASIGYLSGLSGLTVGEVYFLSPTTAGTMTATRPTTAGQVDKPVFQATSTTAGYILNSRGIVLGAGSTSPGSSITKVVALTDDVTISPNCGTTDLGTVTIAGNRTIANPTGTPTDDQKLRFRIKQDATGSRLLTWGSAYRFVGGVTPTLTTTASKIDLVGFNYNAADSKWDCTSFIPNI
jgi:hypothetical protein